MSQVEALPPERIWLQWYGDGSPDDIGDVSVADVTWERDKIFEHDIEYVRADTLSQPDAEWKIMTDAEWKELSAESRFRINEFARHATLSQPNQKCVKCGHEKELSPYGKCLYVDLDNNSQVCECRCEFSQPNPSVAVEAAAKEIGDQFYFTDNDTRANWKGREHEIYNEIAAIISKHLSRER
jgi:hypothetical protein